MIHLKNGRSSEPQMSRLSALVLYQTVVLLHLTHFSQGQSPLVGPLQPIVAMLGDDVILPCYVEPAEDAVSKMVEWARPDLKPRFVHVRRDGVELPAAQHPSYTGRTSLPISKLRRGDLSLKLSKVKISDEGTYRCIFSTEDKKLEVKLAVGSVSPPIVIISKVGTGLLLECKSKGWYPEPEVLWLDGEGNLLPAGPTETVRGPDDLYTVSSRVTVEKRHSNNFTCRVQQKNISQIRETQIHVPDDLFVTHSIYFYITIVLAVVWLICILAVAFVVWKLGCNQNKTKWDRKDEIDMGEREPYMTSRSSAVMDRQVQVLRSEAVKFLDKKMGKLDKERQKNEGERKGVEEAVDALTEYKEGLDTYREHFVLLSHWFGEQIKYNEEKLAASWKQSTIDKYQDIITDLRERKGAADTLLQKTDKLLQRTEDEVTQITERKCKLDEDQEQINEHLREIKRNKDTIRQKM